MLPTSATRRSATGIHGVKSIGTCSKPRRERFQLRRGERQTACLMAAGHIFLSGRKSALSRPTPPPHLCKNGRRRRRRGCISQGCSRLFIRDTFTVAPRWPLSLRLSPVFHYKVFASLGKARGHRGEKRSCLGVKSRNRYYWYVLGRHHCSVPFFLAFWLSGLKSSKLGSPDACPRFTSNLVTVFSAPEMPFFAREDFFSQVD